MEKELNWTNIMLDPKAHGFEECPFSEEADGGDYSGGRIACPLMCLAISWSNSSARF